MFNTIMHMSNKQPFHLLSALFLIFKNSSNFIPRQAIYIISQPITFTDIYNILCAVVHYNVFNSLSINIAI